MRQSLNSTPPVMAARLPAFVRKTIWPWHEMIQFCRIYISFFITEFWQLCKDILKVIIRSQLIQLCGFRNTIYHCTGRCSFCGIVEHPVFLPRQKVRIVLSEAELSIGTLPSSRNICKYFSWLITKLSPCPVFDFGGTVQSLTCCFTHAKNSSTIGLITSCRFWRRSLMRVL